MEKLELEEDRNKYLEKVTQILIFFVFLIYFYNSPYGHWLNFLPLKLMLERSKFLFILICYPNIKGSLHPAYFMNSYFCGSFVIVIWSFKQCFISSNFSLAGKWIHRLSREASRTIQKLCQRGSYYFLEIRRILFFSMSWKNYANKWIILTSACCYLSHYQLLKNIFIS